MAEYDRYLAWCRDENLLPQLVMTQDEFEHAAPPIGRQRVAAPYCHITAMREALETIATMGGTQAVIAKNALAHLN